MAEVGSLEVDSPVPPMNTKLLNHAMADGSRQFATLPQTRDWYGMRDHLVALPDVALTGFLCDGVTEAWIDFTYRGHSFSVNDQYGEYWFFVDEPSCPDDLLIAVVAHCEKRVRR